jgi:hypothetical protein
MSSSVEEHVLYRIANAPVREYPYPHVYAESVFPDDFYAALRRNWPGPERLVSLAQTGRVTKGAYEQRYIMPLVPAEIEALPEGPREFWRELAAWLLGERFLQTMVAKFSPYVAERFGGSLEGVYFGAESLVVRDRTDYSLGPHTDKANRLLSLLFYCPQDDSARHLGTSLYVPRDPSFRCPGGPHYPRELFTRVTTMEYRPNTLFAFVKTDRSFHGVEPIGEEGVLRDLLLYDIRVAHRDPPAAAPSRGKRAGAGFGLLRRLLGGAARR